MLLRGAKIESVGFGRKIDVGIRFDEVEIDIKKVKAGDADECEKAIKAHVGLALSIVGRYAPQAPHKVDDLVGASLLGVVKAVNWFSKPEKKEHDNLTGYIVVTVHRHIQDFLETDHIVRIPRSTLRKELKDIPEEERDAYYETLRPEVIYAHAEWMFPARRNNKLLIIYNEIIREIIESETERYIIEKRGEGLRDWEIAKKLGLTKMRVGQIRHDLYERFRRILRKLL